jgi:hypothetical protein
MAIHRKFAFVDRFWLLATVACSTLIFAEAKPVKISLTTQTPSSIPAMATADIARELSKRCPNAGLTRNAETADYSLEAVGGDRTNPHGQRLYKFTLFDHEGNVVFTTETRQLGNAVKDVCAYINR